VHAMSNPGSLLLSRKPRRRHQRVSRRFCALRVDELCDEVEWHKASIETVTAALAGM
jgi:hypothetical protein